MTARSIAVTEVARSLWGGGAGDVSAPEEATVVAQRLCVQLRVGLSRWVGFEGYRALLDRALEQVRSEHPVLSHLSCDGSDEEEIAAAVRAQGAAEVAAGIMALVATLIDLLGRIIGEEIAVGLVKQAVAASPPTPSAIGTEGGRDG